MSPRTIIPVAVAHPRTLAASLLVAACAAFGCSAPPGDVNSPYDPEELDDGAGGAGDAGGGASEDGGASGAESSGSPTPKRCGAGLSACAGGCIDLETDAQNCGACGSPCALGESCEDGTCS